MRVLCGYIDLNTRICGSTRIYAGIVATLQLRLLLAQDKKTDEERVRSAFYDSDGGNKLFRKTKCKVGIFLHVTLVLI